ncbi:MAG: TrmH family RNA methyltransferase [Chitinophagales bacterium]|jgi:tRNA G18 (ribose-2'-O)-methylase SpoU|nr:TrmH family RNA methyltransferase [Chitinophagales bacterium]
MQFPKKTMDELLRIDAETYSQQANPNFTVILDHIRSAYNVGSIFRTADCFGIKTIYANGIETPLNHKELQKTALGAEKSVNYQFFPEIKVMYEKLKRDGFAILGIEQTKNSIPLNKIEMPNNTKIAIILGNEVMGICDEWLELVDQCIEIPQKGMKHSYNVSNSFSIVGWHFLRFTF